MAKTESIISLDPIDRKKKKGFFSRLLVTRWSGGKKIQKMEPFGHYLFSGAQGSGKSTSVLWYAEKLGRKYKKKRIHYYDRELKEFKRFKEPPKVKLYSNYSVGRHIEKNKIFETIDGFDGYANEVRIVIIDEVHTYFPKGSADKETQKIKDDLTAIFSQLRKRNTYILSTAQVYGRLDKALREQCLFMVDCKVSRSSKLVNDFIPEKDILCDELGRWAGDPKFIYVHGLPKTIYDTKKIIRQ